MKLNKLSNKLNAFVILLSLVLLSSCVSTTKYKAALAQADQKETQLAEAKATIVAVNAKLEALEEEKRNATHDIRKLTSGQKNKTEEKDVTIQNLRSQVKILESRVAAFETKKKVAVNTKTVKKQKNTY